MFCMRNKKINFLVRTLNYSPVMYFCFEKETFYLQILGGVFRINSFTIKGNFLLQIRDCHNSEQFFF